MLGVRSLVRSECPNLPLGILPSGEFVSSAIRAEQGSVFALYTDGLLETANAGGEEFGQIGMPKPAAGHSSIRRVCKFRDSRRTRIGLRSLHRRFARDRECWG